MPVDGEEVLVQKRGLYPSPQNVVRTRQERGACDAGVRVDAAHAVHEILHGIVATAAGQANVE